MHEQESCNSKLTYGVNPWCYEVKFYDLVWPRCKLQHLLEQVSRENPCCEFLLSDLMIRDPNSGWQVSPASVYGNPLLGAVWRQSYHSGMKNSIVTSKIESLFSWGVLSPGYFIGRVRAKLVKHWSGLSQGVSRWANLALVLVARGVFVCFLTGS